MAPPSSSRVRRRSAGSGGLLKGAALATCLLAHRGLPWPCLFASAASNNVGSSGSITRRLASAASQSSRTLVQQQFNRDVALVGRQLYQADDQYVQQGAGDYDDDAVNEAMNAREEAADDDGFISMANVDFGEVSVMPVSCVN